MRRSGPEPPTWASHLAAHAPALGRLRDAILDAAELRPGDVVLDLGAGTGLLTFGAVPRVGPGGRVIAADLDPGCLDALSRQALGRGLGGRHVQVVAASAVALPLADAAVDSVVVRSALAYVADRPRAARECWRVLRPGRRVSLFEPLPGGLREEADFDWRPVWAVRLALERLRDEARRDPTHAAPLGLTADGLARAFRAAGFAEVSVECGERAAQVPAAPAEHFDLFRPPGRPGAASWHARLREHLPAASLHAYVEHALAMAARGRYRVRLPVVWLRARRPAG